MDTRMLELMQDQVRAIYRALMGSDLPETNAEAQPHTGTETVPVEGVVRLFAELEEAARGVPRIAERVPPFYFVPPIDVSESEGELLVDLGVPGIEKKDVQVELSGDQLTIFGVRTGERAANGRSLLRAELPRGPFRRIVRLPYPISAEPRFEVEQGLIRVRLSRKPKRAAARA